MKKSRTFEVPAETIECDRNEARNGSQMQIDQNCLQPRSKIIESNYWKLTMLQNVAKTSLGSTWRFHACSTHERDVDAASVWLTVRYVFAFVCARLLQIFFEHLRVEHQSAKHDNKRHWKGRWSWVTWNWKLLRRPAKPIVAATWWQNDSGKGLKGLYNYWMLLAFYSCLAWSYTTQDCSI